MFLTGQQFENGLTMQVNEPSKNSKGNSEVITYHGKTIEVKDRLTDLEL